jgi:hypothetical protein
MVLNGVEGSRQVVDIYTDIHLPVPIPYEHDQSGSESDNAYFREKTQLSQIGRLDITSGLVGNLS